ncbi:MAG: flagellar biosynthesis protein FlhF [Armatimonadetes bacterium]|nr:flagellar biosynthesis protein FlhF [Armatimonadota bacterium]
MKIKRYEAPTMQEALMKVRSDLGPDAVILHTKKFTRGGILGMMAKETVEILAADDVHIAEPASRRPAVEAPPEPVEDRRIRTLESQIQSLQGSVERLLKDSHPQAQAVDPRLAACYERLLASGVDEPVVQKIMAQIPAPSGLDDRQAETLVPNALRGFLEVSGPVAMAPGLPKVVALIGPTGVGKTTTIAKMSANFALLEKKKVALTTVDTYRVAAVEQLKTYGDIIDIPIRVAHTAKELRSALDGFADRDLIFIDTAGRSQKNTLHLSELKMLLGGIPCETHLVLSLATRDRELYDIIERFSMVEVDRLLFTKLDETDSYGAVLNVLDRRRIPISYVTTGQKVPEDIEMANPDLLVRLILGGQAS